MEWRTKEGLKWLTYEVFDGCPELTALTLSRHGGVSPPPFDSLNLGDGLGDAEENVIANCRKVEQALEIPKLVRGDQVHASHIAIITPESPDLIPATDGLITAEPRIALTIKHADCQAALFYDPTRKVIGAVHAGWRGLVEDIYAVAINRMEKEFHCRPENLLCAISPSLGPEESEFVHYKDEFPEPFWDHQTKSNHFDLWEISYERLIEAGLLPDHIEIARVSTYAEKEDFFSARRSKKTGRNGTLVMLKN